MFTISVLVIATSWAADRVIGPMFVSAIFFNTLCPFAAIALRVFAISFGPATVHCVPPFFRWSVSKPDWFALYSYSMIRSRLFVMEIGRAVCRPTRLLRFRRSAMRTFPNTLYSEPNTCSKTPKKDRSEGEKRVGSRLYEHERERSMAFNFSIKSLFAVTSLIIIARVMIKARRWERTYIGCNCSGGT